MCFKTFGQGWDTEDIVNTLVALWDSLELVFIDGRLYLTNTAQSTGRHLHQKVLHESSLEVSLWVYKREHHDESDLYLDELVLRLGVEHNIAISVSALHETLKTSCLTRKFLQKIAIERGEDLRQQWRDMQASEDFLPKQMNSSSLRCYMYIICWSTTYPRI